MKYYLNGAATEKSFVGGVGSTNPQFKAGQVLIDSIDYSSSTAAFYRENYTNACVIELRVVQFSGDVDIEPYINGVKQGELISGSDNEMAIITYHIPRSGTFELRKQSNYTAPVKYKITYLGDAPSPVRAIYMNGAKL